jgi:hypothetical protein
VYNDYLYADITNNINKIFFLIPRAEKGITREASSLKQSRDKIIKEKGEDYVANISNEVVNDLKAKLQEYIDIELTPEVLEILGKRQYLVNIKMNQNEGSIQLIDKIISNNIIT